MRAWEFSYFSALHGLGEMFAGVKRLLAGEEAAEPTYKLLKETHVGMKEAKRHSGS